MSKSIISNEKQCYLCQTPYNLERHHIYFGTANRQISESQGCWIWLCNRHHTGKVKYDEGIHFNPDLDLRIKRECQEVWEREKGNRQEFRKLFGKSWL